MTYNNYHLIHVKYIGPTNTRGSRVKMTSQRFNKSQTISYMYELNDIADMARQHLEKQGFHFIGQGESVNGAVILISDTFKTI